MTTSPKVILALESSAGVGSVAVFKDGAVLSEAKIESPHGHAAWIIPLVQDVLEDSRLGFDDLTSVVAGCGPGSFTGIRVALAAAKGLGLALGITPIGLSSLAAMAHHDGDKAHAVIGAIDSRRKTTYMQAFSSDFSQKSAIIDGASQEVVMLAEDLGGGHDFIVNGHDAEIHTELLIEAGFKAKTGEAVFPLAADLCHYHHAHPTQNDGLEPLYLAPPIITPSSKSKALAK